MPIYEISLVASYFVQAMSLKMNLVFEDHHGLFEVFHFLMVAFYAQTLQRLNWQLNHERYGFDIPVFPLVRHHRCVDPKFSRVLEESIIFHGRIHQFPKNIGGPIL